MLIDFELPLRGLAAGFMIAAPIGPVNVLCIQRVLEKGWKAGLASGLGAAAVDTFYGGIAGFSISLVIQFLLREESRIRFIGGILLIGIGVVYYFKRPGTLRAGKSNSASHSDFVTAVLLTATNPTTILSFLAVLTMLGLGSQRPLWQTSLLVGGIFLGSMTWWLILSGGTNMLRDKVTDKTLLWLNRAGGLAIGIFGVVNLVVSRVHKA